MEQKPPAPPHWANSARGELVVAAMSCLWAGQRSSSSKPLAVQPLETGLQGRICQLLRISINQSINQNYTCSNEIHREFMPAIDKKITCFVVANKISGLLHQPR
jgi:hypothetical protein